MNYGNYKHRRSKNPGRPVEITFAAETGLPSQNQEVLIIGHKDATSGSVAAYSVSTITNSGDETACSAEVATKFGAGSEIAKMILAAVRANRGGGTFPQIKAVPLDAADTDFGPSDDALVTVKKQKAEFVVSPYDAEDSTLRGKLKDAVLEMSGAQRVENNQFGSVGVVFNRSVVDASLLSAPDTQFILPVWLRDTGTAGDAPLYGIGEMAAAAACKIAAGAIPFNPLNSVTIQGVAAPSLVSDWPTVGAALESEVALNKGYTPLYVKANGEVAFVRTRTSRISPDGSGAPLVTAYYDMQDFQVLYFWRKTIWTRFSQPDFKQRKASNETAREIKAELIRLATSFEDQNMFQHVKELSKFFIVERSATDRHRFDVKTPVNVIPGLHVIASNIEATTEFDTVTV
jgi:phage tail sheath gpL-like